jgi:putative transposase
MRLPRPVVRNCCIHVTHRCHERQFLLKFDIDRNYYQQLLYQASEKFNRVRFLDYAITSNHIHLLVWTPKMEYLSEMMHWLQGTFAQYYNRRKGREGSFWRGRFHPTLVESGRHLSRCLLYLDMNMVRAGAVNHPSEWDFGGYQELCGNRKRYRIIDQDRLLNYLEIGDIVNFREWHGKTLDELCSREEHPRERFWSRSFAVGSPEWFEEISPLKRQNLQKYIEPAGDSEDSGTYVINPPQSVLSRWWKTLRSK